MEALKCLGPKTITYLCLSVSTPPCLGCFGSSLQKSYHIIEIWKENHTKLTQDFCSVPHWICFRTKSKPVYFFLINRFKDVKLCSLVHLLKSEPVWRTGRLTCRLHRLKLQFSLTSINMSVCWHSVTQNTKLNSRHSWFLDVKLVKWSNPTNTCMLPLFNESKPSVITGRCDLLTWLRSTVWALGSRSRINGSLALRAFVHVVFLWGGNISFVSPQESRPQTSWKRRRGRFKAEGREQRAAGRVGHGWDG